MNIYKRMRQLLVNKDPRLIGKVVTVSGGRTTIQTPSGGLVTVVGTGVAEGGMAYYKGGVLEGEAPALTTYEIDV